MTLIPTPLQNSFNKFGGFHLQSLDLGMVPDGLDSNYSFIIMVFICLKFSLLWLSFYACPVTFDYRYGFFVRLFDLFISALVRNGQRYLRSLKKKKDYLSNDESRR